MSPLTHLVASWIVAAKTTDNLRDRRLVTLAGVAPDLDGLGLLIDYAKGAFTSGHYHYYPKYHHWLAHGLPAAEVCSALMATLALRRSRVLWLAISTLHLPVLAALARHWCRIFWLAMLTFHLHLLCDFVGSRGPDKGDIWAIFYLGPLSHRPVWFWKYQWPLNGWQNMAIFVVLLAWSLALAVKKGDSFVGVFNHRCDRVFVGVLRKWHDRLWPPSSPS
jgi:inner membrane protein